MTCETLEESLLDLIEGLLDEATAEHAHGHLRECRSCRAAMRETKDVIDAIQFARDRQESAPPHQPGSSAANGKSLLAFWEPDTLLGDFQILEVLGHGGMGTVYKARQRTLNRLVALKVMPHGAVQSENNLARFQREAQAAAKLHHSNIVPVYSQGEHGGHLYYEMELVDGIDLGRILRNDPEQLLSRLGTPIPSLNALTDADEDASPGPDRRLPRTRHDYRKLARLIAEIADALEYAHTRNVLHRDIKPQNLLLASDGRLHITDFGLARLTDEPSMTHSGEMLGTPAYMSPEQIDVDGERVDHRTDIYSLGVTLYELLTGQRPFEAPTRDQILARIRQREARPPRKVNPLVPTDLETICLRAMEKDPRRRYQNAGAMRDDLVRYADHRPIVSRRVRAAERAFKWVRRHPAMTTITSLSIALTVVAVLWSRQASASRREKADSLVAKAIELLTYDNYRDWEQARGYLTVAEKLDPEPARLAVAEGMCHLVGNPKLAIEHFHRAIELEPSNIRVMYLLGWACRADQQLSAFREWVAKADAASGPGSDAVAHFFRGQALVRLDPLEATKNYRTAERLSDSFYQVKLHLARALNHEMYHRRTLENFGEIKRTLEAACILRQKAAYPRYLLSLASRLAGEIYRDLGNAALARVNFDAALQSALDAQRVEPDSPQSHTCEAEYWESQGDLVRALGARDRGAEHCKSALDRLELHEYRWRLCYWLGQHDRAMSDLSELVKLCSPTDPKLKWHLHLFPALILADMGRIDESIAKARLLASESPGEFRAIVSAAALLRTHGASDEADQLVRDARRKWEASQNKSPAGQARQRLLLLDFFEGHRTWGELTAEIAKDSSLEALMPKAHFTAGCRALAEGDRELAASCFRACEITYDFDDYCYAGRVFAVRLQGDSTWPNWLARH